VTCIVLLLLVLLKWYYTYYQGTSEVVVPLYVQKEFHVEDDAYDLIPGVYFSDGGDLQVATPSLCKQRCNGCSFWSFRPDTGGCAIHDKVGGGQTTVSFKRALPPYEFSQLPGMDADVGVDLGATDIQSCQNKCVDYACADCDNCQDCDKKCVGVRFDGTCRKLNPSLVPFALTGVAK